MSLKEYGSTVLKRSEAMKKYLGKNDKFFLFDFDKELKPNCKIKCNDCNKWVNEKDWIETCNYCEDCGDHAALMCPECGGIFDMVYHPEFKVNL